MTLERIHKAEPVGAESNTSNTRWYHFPIVALLKLYRISGFVLRDDFDFFIYYKDRANKQTERAEMLEDCPFCGGEFKLHQDTVDMVGGIVNDGGWYIGHGASNAKGCRLRFEGYFPSKEEAIKACNTRTSKTEWRDISSIPDDGESYIVWNGRNYAYARAHDLEKLKDIDTWLGMPAPTHWTHKPKPPQGD